MVGDLALLHKLNPFPRSREMKKPVIIFLLLVLAVTWSGKVFAGNFQSFFKENLRYLEDIPEVAWVKFEKKYIIIGWKGFPSKFNRLNREAALNAHRATGQPVQVWSVRHIQKTCKIGKGPYICATKADRGKVLESNCHL